MNEMKMASATSGEALVERVVASTIGLFDLAGLYLGQRLGLYRRSHDEGAATSRELADRTGVDERYAREWLEHQAVTGLLEVDDETADAKSAATRCRRVRRGAGRRRQPRLHRPAGASGAGHAAARCRSSWRRSGPARVSRIPSTARTPVRGSPS